MPVKELPTPSQETYGDLQLDHAEALTPAENEMFDSIADAYTQADQHETEDSYDTVRQRIGAKLGRFAARSLNNYDSMKASIKERVNSTTMAAGVRGKQALMSAQERAEKGVVALQDARDKLRDTEEDSKKKNRLKRLGRGAMAAAGLVGLSGAAVLIVKANEKGILPIDMSDRVNLAYRGSEIADGPLIHVPGTGHSAPANVYNGDRVDVGYHASAGPFVEGPRYDVSVAQGVERLFEALEKTGDGVKTVEGYSQGADVIREAVSKLSEDEQRQLVLNISGDPSGETGVLTLAHGSWQSDLMNALGFDTSELKSTGAATVNEVRVTNDIMADATYTIADAEKFNAAIERQDYVSVLRMLATTAEKAGGYATNHAGMIDVLPEHRVFHDPVNPGNATVVTEHRPNGVLHKITPNVTALEQIAASQFGIELTPEAREAYRTIIDPNASQEHVVRGLGAAAREGIDNTPWIHPDHKPIIGQIITGVTEGMAAHQPSAPVPAPAPVVAEAFVAPAQPVPEYVPEPAYVAPAPAVPVYVPPVEVQHFVEQAAPVVEQIQQTIPQVNVDQIATDLKHIAPQLSADIDAVHGMLQPQQ